MKKNLSVCFLAVFMALFIPVRSLAQDEIPEVALAKEEMTEYYEELQAFDRAIVTVEDAERLETEYTNHILLVETCFKTNSEFFRYDKKLMALYNNYKDLYKQIGKRIDDLKAEQKKQEQLDKLVVKFNRYEATLTKYEQDANRCVENKQADSLAVIQKEAAECYNSEAAVDYGINRDFIEENEELSQTWKRIKEIHSRISTLEVQKSPFDMDMILKIVGILAAVVLIVTMISNKIKAAKLTNPKKKEPKKPKEEPPTPSI